MKMRDYINASSLGSYFGVGFNLPDEQFSIDIGEVEPEFDDDAKDRMERGKILEDACLNYFEYKFGIIIDNRNVDTMSLYNGKLRGKVDGETILNGLKTVVENKVSNAKSYKFTENLGYLLQCQAYMIDNDYEQALLCGMYQGEFIYKIIPRDEEMIQDIKEMADYIVDCLLGLNTFDNDTFPHHLYEKYSKTKVLPKLDIVNTPLEQKLERLYELKKQTQDFKLIEDEIKQLENELKETYDDGIIETQSYKVTLQNQKRKGGLDTNSLMLSYPEIDYSKFQLPDSAYKVLRFTFKKGK